MKKAIITLASAAALLFAMEAKAQTNLQTFYDFGSDRHYLTTTLEGFYGDKWGNTFFFIDHDYNSRSSTDNHIYAPSGTYWEIARCLNFWQGTAMAPVSLHIEYNGGVYNGYTINNAYLAGIDYSIHSSDFKNTLNLKVLYKYIDYNNSSLKSKVPMQFTMVWGLQDIFGVKGLRFNGFADFWWEEHTLYKDNAGTILPETANTVFISEPQIWYNVGSLFGCGNLNVGSEIELSYNFATSKGFWCRPCLGTKWVF